VLLDSYDKLLYNILMKKQLPPDKEIVKMYQDGLSAKAIADKLGCHQATILQHLKNAGCERRSFSEAHKLGYASGRRKVTVKSGEDHYMWKGGVAKRDYRNVVKKVKCDVCGGRLNLGIHHKDLDHYNNSEENLQVLCVSCHMSLHKQAYWDAIHSGSVPEKSNGPVGWNRKEE